MRFGDQQPSSRFSVIPLHHLTEDTYDTIIYLNGDQIDNIWLCI